MYHILSTFLCVEIPARNPTSFSGWFLLFVLSSDTSLNFALFPLLLCLFVFLCFCCVFLCTSCLTEDKVLIS